MSTEGKARGNRETAKHLRENLVMRPEIPVHGMRDGVAAPIIAIVAPAHGKQHEPLRILDRKEPQQDLIEEGEDRGVGTNSQRESQDGDGRKAGGSGQHAEGILQVAKRGIQPAADVRGARAFLVGRSHRGSLARQLEVETKKAAKSLMKVR